MAITIIQQQDLHQEDFDVVNGNVRIKEERLKQLMQEKTAEVQDYVLEVVNPNATQIIADANTDTRKMVSINGMGLGIISLDFICRVNSNRTVAFRMPEGAPLPTKTISTSAGSGLLWWNKGSREIVFSQVKSNERVVLNLVGMFV
ncbi:hypothetical protein [Haemophilus parahaemolyticus]|uniref:hypothetical protein n=1 Tax=Haemophilus parahaemolyticus TaxID=735 RepID=UPI0028E9811E|nr:hypothetical protein [Haemophilus parahaemolyticus]